ncbi:MAG: VanZ family protein [Roseburia sp.]|nr:VanZ family protein [Roseburia sp.]
MNYKTGKARAIKFIWILAAVLWMALIFRYSGQRAQVSSELSGSLSYRLAGRVSEWFSLGLGEETLMHYGEIWEHPLRKAAHMTEYAILSALFFGNFYQYTTTYQRKYFLAWICATCYAATDEFHQLFVEGRSGQITDVCIDSAGAFVGLCFVYLVLWMLNNVLHEADDK